MKYSLVRCDGGVFSRNRATRIRIAVITGKIAAADFNAYTVTLADSLARTPSLGNTK
jgi:hypothetical protein